ncbi:MAG: hypothetical protein K9L60_07255 [Methylovulum sp.]|nr:hypothetical protein [Methylovulum sp.]MCF7999090.1 hypothetical protein [Methylovulum sp.]
MSPINALFAKLAAVDIRLFLDGERLRFDAPQGALTDALRSELQTHKADIIAHLQAHQASTQNEPRHYPFSFAQQHFWSLQQLNPTDCFYTVPFAFRLTGELNIDVLRQSFNAIVSRHEILRTTLQHLEGKHLQIVAPTADADLVIVKNVLEAQLSQLISDELHIPFDLTTASCLRARLFSLPDNQAVLLLCLHILIYDQRSLNALLYEISAHYDALIAGKSANLPPLALQYGDYAKDQQDLLATPMQHRIDYWQTWFAQGEPQQWTWQTQQDSRAPAFEADILWQHFDSHLMQQLKLLAQSCGVTLYMTLMAAYSVLLYRYTDCPDVVIGTTFANRGRWQFDNMIGSSLSVLSLRIHLEHNPDWQTLLNQIRENVAQAMAHQDIPFRVIMPIVQPERTQFTPLFHAILSFLAETAHNELNLTGVKVEFMEHVANPSSRPDLYLTVWEKSGDNGEGLSGYWLPQKNLFSDAESALLLQHYQQLLQIMVQAPNHTIKHAMAELDCVAQ